MNETTTPSQAWTERADAVIAPTYVRPARVFASGKGLWLTDLEGRQVLDFTSGIAVTGLGHQAPQVKDTLREHADAVVHTSNLFHTQPPIELAEALVAASFADKVFFCNSGTEAVEGALKFARLYSKRPEVLCFRKSFHGRSLGALGVTDKPTHHETFGPMKTGRFLDYNDDAAFAEITEATGAVIVEPLQGEGGVNPARPEWLRGLRERCDAVGAALIFDQVQCGLGRTGDLWSHSFAGVEPDLMTLAKPLGGGLPIGAVLMRQSIADAISPGDHGTTFGGNPLIARVALAVFQAINTPGLLQNVRDRGEQLRQIAASWNHPHVQHVRGRGLLNGLVVDVPPADVVQAALDQDLLVVVAAGGVVRLAPALIVSEQEIEDGMSRLKRALDSV